LKNKLKIIAIIPLVLVMLAMFAFVACGEPYDNGDPPEIVITSVVISPNERIVGVNGGTFQLTAEVRGLYGQDKQIKTGAVGIVNWRSSNPTIAIVNSSGLVTGLTNGEVTITARSAFDSTVYGEAQITVANIPPSFYFPYMTLSGDPHPSTLRIGDTFELRTITATNNDGVGQAQDPNTFRYIREVRLDGVPIEEFMINGIGLEYAYSTRTMTFESAGRYTIRYKVIDVYGNDSYQYFVITVSATSPQRP